MASAKLTTTEATVTVKMDVAEAKGLLSLLTSVSKLNDFTATFVSGGHSSRQGTLVDLHNQLKAIL